MKTLLLGGPFNGAQPDLPRLPMVIEVAGVFYQQITDPDTGDGLGAYAVAPKGWRP